MFFFFAMLLPPQDADSSSASYGWCDYVVTVITKICYKIDFLNKPKKLMLIIMLAAFRKLIFRKLAWLKHIK